MIKVRKGESLEQALRRFNSLVYKAGVLTDFRAKERHIKKSELKRIKNKEKARKIAQYKRQNR